MNNDERVKWLNTIMELGHKVYARKPQLPWYGLRDWRADLLSHVQDFQDRLASHAYANDVFVDQQKMIVVFADEFHGGFPS